VLGIGCFLIFMVPTGCAIFPQNCEIKTASLKMSEPEYGADEAVPKALYFNKGL
jgi:hypothetical protein